MRSRWPVPADCPTRRTAEPSDPAGFLHTRANLWRYEPGARGRRHVHADQEETFVVVDGTLTMYLGEPRVCQDGTVGGLIHVAAGTLVQAANHGDADLVVYAYGSRPDQGADVLPDAV
jgi:quercetin dioxygenase-like cupin family protein